MTYEKDLEQAYCFTSFTSVHMEGNFAIFQKMDSCGRDAIYCYATAFNDMFHTYMLL